MANSRTGYKKLAHFQNGVSILGEIFSRTGCQFGVPGGTYPPKKYPSAPPGSVETVENDTKTWKRKLCLETNKKRTHFTSNFFQLGWQAFIHDLPFTDIFIVFHTCINFPFWCLLIVNCRWYIFVGRGFRRVYKWRGLYPRGVYTSL